MRQVAWRAFSLCVFPLFSFSFFLLPLSLPTPPLLSSYYRNIITMLLSYHHHDKNDSENHDPSARPSEFPRLHVMRPAWRISPLTFSYLRPAKSCVQCRNLIFSLSWFKRIKLRRESWFSSSSTPILPLEFMVISFSIVVGVTRQKTGRLSQFWKKQCYYWCLQLQLRIISSKLDKNQISLFKIHLFSRDFFAVARVTPAQNQHPWSASRNYKRP